jgi:hypothetical protein
VQARAQQPGVQGELVVGGESRDQPRALAVSLDGGPVRPDELGVGRPLDVFGGVERGEPPYFNFSLIFEIRPPALVAVSASAKSSAVV